MTVGWFVGTKIAKTLKEECHPVKEKEVQRPVHEPTGNHWTEREGTMAEEGETALTERVRGEDS